MPYFTAKPIHLYAREFDTDVWIKDKNSYSEFNVKKGEYCQPYVETYFDEQELYKGSMLIKMPDGYTVVLNKEVFETLYEPLEEKAL